MSKKDYGCRTSEFYCVECGKAGIPISRKPGQQREKGHLKNLFCLHCNKETNHCEIRPYGSYTKEDFLDEFNCGRFINGKRVAVADLTGCSKFECDYNRDGKCWNANHSYECPHRRER